MHSPNVQFDPKVDEVPRLACRFRQASQIIALLVAALGLVVLGGWAFDVPILTYIRPTFQSMKVNTALCFLFLGVGLWLANDDTRQRSRRILGLAVAIIAGATLAEYGFHVSLGIDQLLFRDTRNPSLSAYQGRMAIATALCFLFLGLAVAFSGVRKAIVLQRALVAACFALSLVALCGYLYGAKSLYSITAFSTMGLHTSAGLFGACLAYFLSRPDEGIVSIAAGDSNSGFLLRILVPAIIVVPILIGWLRLVGQRANLYDTPFGTALLVLVSIGCLGVLTMLVARSMYRWECESSHAGRMIRESEERFRLVANNAPVMIWMSGLDTKPTYFNQLWLDFTGLSETDLRNGLAGIVHPEDYLQCHDVYCRGFDQRQPFRKECRLRRHDGQYRWMLDIGVPRFLKDGSFAGYIGSCIDVTDRKLAEDALTNMGRKLVEAQEQERARIARELHDDINQRLALLALELEQLKENPSEVGRRVKELQQHTREIANDLQVLSHDLHSSQLEYLGVVAGMKSWCKEFGVRQGMQIDCRHDVRSTLPQEIGLCLFRLLQEALHNAAKHSGMKRIEVQLHEEAAEIHLIVRDSGNGFDVEAVKQGKGLGLTSMRERVRLVNGTILIESKPMSGTTIHVRVPLEAEHVSQRAAG